MVPGIRQNLTFQWKKRQRESEKLFLSTLVSHLSMSVIANKAPASGGETPKGVVTHPGDVGSIVSRFQKLLGAKWDRYQTSISLFLVGKSTREELLLEIDDVLANPLQRKLHNQLLVAMLANSFKSHPMDGIGGGFGSQRKRKNMSKSSQWDEIKKVVLSLPIKERMRIKAITRESGKRGLTSNIIVQTRQALVPRIPIVTSSSQELQNKNLARTMVSVKDILDMVNAPLSTEAYELPERTALRDRMIGSAREYGILGSVSLKAADVLYLGLQHHLKSIISSTLDTVISRSDNKPGKRTIHLTMEDMFDMFTLAPHMIEPYGSMDLLTDSMLKNDDDYDILTRYKELVEPSLVESEHIINTGPGGPVFVVPEKISPISYLLKPKSSIKQEPQALQGSQGSSQYTSESTLGTPEELQWLINDLLAGE